MRLICVLLFSLLLISPAQSAGKDSPVPVDAQLNTTAEPAPGARFHRGPYSKAAEARAEPGESAYRCPRPPRPPKPPRPAWCSWPAKWILILKCDQYCNCRWEPTCIED